MWNYVHDTMLGFMNESQNEYVLVIWPLLSAN